LFFLVPDVSLTDFNEAILDRSIQTPQDEQS